MSMLDVLRALGHLDSVVLPTAVETMLTASDPGLPTPLPDDPALISTAGTGTLTGELPLALGASLPTGTTAPWTVELFQGGAQLVLRLLDGTQTGAIPSVYEATSAPVGAGARERVKYLASPVGLTLKVSGSLAVRFVSGRSEVQVSKLVVTTSTPDIALPGGFGLTLPTPFSIVAGALDLDPFTLALPDRVPVLGSLPLAGSLAGIRGGETLTLEVPASGQDPKAGGTLTFQLPERFSLADLVPTSLNVTIDLPTMHSRWARRVRSSTRPCAFGPSLPGHRTTPRQ